MFNLKKIIEVKEYLNTLQDSLRKYDKQLSDKNQELIELRKQLLEAKDLKSILQKVGDIGNTVFIDLNKLKISCANDKLLISDDIPQYVEDIFDESKKVIKQESNLGILIDKDGNVKIGRTRFACDKNRNYKLKQL